VLLLGDEVDLFNAVEALDVGDVLVHEDADALLLHEQVDGVHHFGAKALADFRGVSIFTHDHNLSITVTN